MTRRLAASIAIATALATSGVWADTTATYATGDTSLADGKVLFEYDGSDNITKLTMTPGADEKLILTGDALPFAAGAQIAFSASGGGTNVIANPFTTAGALEFAGPTNMTWGGSDYLPNDGTYVTILENVNLANIVPVEGYGMNGGSAPTYGAEDNLYAPYFIVRDGDKMRFELRHDTRYVFVELVQDGDNIKGRVLLSGRGGTVSADSPIFNYNDGTVTVNGGVNTTYKPYAYEKQKWLVFSPRYGTPKLTFAVPCMTNMTWGGGVYLPNSGDPVLLFENVNLADIEPVESYGMIGSAAPTYGADANRYMPYYIVRDGDKMRFELRNSDCSRYVFVELTQDGDDIKGKVLLSGRGTVNANESIFTYNSDGSVSAASGANTTYKAYQYEKQKWLTIGARKVELPAISGSGVEVTFDSNAFGDTVGELTSEYPATVTANGRNDMVGAFIVKGDASHPIAFDVDNLNALPDGTTDCYGNADLYINVGANNSGVSDGKSVITMHDGSRLHQESKNAFKKGTQHIALDGSTLYVNKDSAFTNDTVWTYLDYLELSNASQVTGGVVRAVHTASNPTWSVTGTGASVCDASIYLVQNSWNALTIDVADTVAGDETDFIFNGEARCNSFGAGLKKTGSGTMLVNGVISNSTYIAEGTLLLGKSGAIATGEDTQVKFELQGGTLALAAGTENAVNGVTLTENSIISMGAGASLTIASLTIPEGKTLDIAFAGAVDSRSVKVLDTLDSPTLSRIRLNGRRPGQNEEGYLCPRGFIISVF